MNFSYVALDPVQVTKPGPHANREARTHQGIPGIERLPSGRLFAVWYAGGVSECNENYVAMTVSDDDGKSWSDTVAVVDPENPDVRAFDSTLWISPEGKFYWFWTQGCGGPDGSWDIYDGIAGVWCSILENPDDDPAEFRFTPSRRIFNGIMMNKPTVLTDGTWALPCSVWSGDYRKHDSLGVRSGAYMVTSTDSGETFHVRGRIEMADVEGGPIFDEHMFMERKNGELVSRQRNLFRKDSSICARPPCADGAERCDHRASHRPAAECANELQQSGCVQPVPDLRCSGAAVTSVAADRISANRPPADTQSFRTNCVDATLVCCLRVKAGIAESVSRDGGRTWSKPELSRSIHGPSSRLLIRRLNSGRWLLVFNDSCGERKKMTAFLSEDEGATWPFKLLLDTTDCVVSYPDGLETADGTLYVIYDADRQNGGYIRMARFTEADIRAGKIVSPQSALMIEVDHSRPVPTP